MQILTENTAIQALCKELRLAGKSIALVPTMGYLHEGHLSLIRIARAKADVVIVSRFVNPAQFAPGEDLEAYPNNREHDHKVSKDAGADIMFEPLASEMYGNSHATWVEVPAMAKLLCGKTRPTHFRGVCTVVTKLFHIIAPHMAVFGEKDWQQITLIRRMVKDLNFDVEIIGGPLVRDSDGLALSSRNAYLTKEERALAPQIRKGLLLLQQEAMNGEDNSTALARFFEHHIAEHLPLAKIDYIGIVDPDSLEAVETITQKTIVAVAVYVGKARLLDNIAIVPN